MEKQIIDANQTIKANIQRLIEGNQLQSARQLLVQYIEMASGDTDIFSIQAIIEMQEGNLDEAILIIRKGLKMIPGNFDLLYNLACAYEMQEDYSQAYDVLQQLKQAPQDDVQKQMLLVLQERILLKCPVEMEQKRKLIFFVKPQMDSFLGNIIESLKNDYIVKKCIVTEANQIDEGMEWADICWFEWCDELVIYGSQLDVAKRKKILCRLHSYEAFTEYPEQVKWENIEEVIFVAEHIRAFVLEHVPTLKNEQTIIIPNGIDLKKYTYKERKPGFNIAYVGYINYKKGPMLLLHAFKAIYDKDNRYKLYIAGQFQDPRDVLYFKQMIKEWKLENNVIYEGWQSNINQWLDDKNYLISTSVLEGHPIGIMEAMAMGIKPLVHCFVGSRNVYLPIHIWTNFDELCMMLQTAYNSWDYKQFIEQHYSLKEQMKKIEDVIELIIKNDNKLIVLKQEDSIERRFIANSDNIDNTERFFTLLLQKGQKQKYMKALSSWFVRSRYDLTSRLNYYYINLYRRGHEEGGVDYFRFEYIDDEAYKEMDKIAKNIHRRLVCRFDFVKRNKSDKKKECCLFVNGLDSDPRQSVVKFLFNYIENSEKQLINYTIVSLLTQEEFNNSEEGINLFRKLNIEIFVPKERDIEKRIEEYYKFFKDRSYDFTIYQSFYFSPVAIFTLPLMREKSHLIGRFQLQQPEPYFDKNLDFLEHYSNRYHYCKNIIQIVSPLRNDLVEVNRDIKKVFNIPPSKKILVSTGRIDKYFDQEYWGVICKLVMEVEELVFVFLGGEYKRLKNYIPPQLIESGKIILPGFIQDASQYLTSCDFYINSPLPGGYSFAEAYYAGLPIITFFERNIKDGFSMVQEGNFIIEAYYEEPEKIFPQLGNYDELFEFAKKMIVDSSFESFIQKKRKAKKEDMTYIAFVKRMEQSLLELLSRKQ